MSRVNGKVKSEIPLYRVASQPGKCGSQLDLRGGHAYRFRLLFLAGDGMGLWPTRSDDNRSYRIPAAVQKELDSSFPAASAEDKLRGNEERGFIFMRGCQ
jgi:hypothetical protein